VIAASTPTPGRAPTVWSAARADLDGLPAGWGLNIAYEAVDRHLKRGHGDAVALRCLGADGSVRDFTYAELSRASNRFANVLRRLGVGPGDRVFLLLGRVPELYVAVLGALKVKAVVAPLFSAFGPGPVTQRLRLGDGRLLVTSAAHYRRKVAAARADLPALRHVLLVDDPGDLAGPGVDALPALLAAAPDDFEIPPTDPEDMALLHFTSGTTGTPKGAVHVHEAVVAHQATARSVLDLRRGDVYWCTADPGWVTGTSYGIVAPLCVGATVVVDEREFDVSRWYATLAAQRVTVWYTAPTAVRMLMRAGAARAREHDLSALRLVASVGEPLHAEGVTWGEEALGHRIHDTWWQTETGAIMIANLPGMDIRPGSMGKPVHGVEAAVLALGEGGRAAVRHGMVRELVEPDGVGELALRPGWPSMFRGYLHADERYRACFAGGWYLTGDLARCDADGYLWFCGRADDVIKSAGHLVGPFEVESALLEHPAVAEAGVFGVPDALAGELVTARVSLRPGYDPSPELRRELIGFARSRLGAAVAPKSLDFDQQLPKTRSGKIMRRLLRARALGLAEGDVSGLDEPGGPS
jgi:acetyl-CoA synthetase